eukprot:1192523-Prorocentrum_minimum.AAC.2
MSARGSTRRHAGETTHRHTDAANLGVARIGRSKRSCGQDRTIDTRDAAEEETEGMHYTRPTRFLVPPNESSKSPKP